MTQLSKQPTAEIIISNKNDTQTAKNQRDVSLLPTEPELQPTRTHWLDLPVKVRVIEGCLVLTNEQ